MSNNNEQAPRRNVSGPLGVFAAACLAIAVATEAAPVVQNLRWWLATAFRNQPYDLRLRLNRSFRDAVLAAHALTPELDRDTPVLIKNKGGPDWLLAYRLQPHRVYVSRSAVRNRLKAAGSPFLLVDLDRRHDSTARFFEHFDATGEKRTTSRETAAILIDGFEGPFDVWAEVVTRERR